MAFLGMKGTGDWAENERPENWRETILYLYPNGSAPITGILSMIGSERTDDPVFHWWTKTLPEQGGDVTNVYTDANLNSAYSGDNYSKGQTVYVKAAESVISEFAIDKQVLLRDKDNYSVDTTGYVTDRVLNGADSYISVKLIEDTSSANDLDGVDRMIITGNANEEGAEMPDSISYDPVEYDNYTQIFRNSLSISRTSRKTRLRTGDAYQERKRETLELHSIEMEKALIWGVKYSTTGPRNKPKRFTQGLRNFITSNEPENVDDFTSNADFSGDSWLQGGEEWLDDQLERIFRYGRPEKLGVVGSGAMKAINRLSKVSGDINLRPMTASYGLKVVEWITPFGTLYLKTHPLFSYEPTNRNSMIVMEPSKIKTRFIDDTTFYEDPQDDENRNNNRDGTEEEFLSELGWEYHHPPAFGYLNGFGQANTA